MAKIGFESETCGRCGGSGRYSYNQMDGDRCYGCGGSGRRLTKRGAAASARLREKLTLDVTEVRSGMTIRFDVCTMGGASGALTRTVERVEEDKPISGKILQPDGTWKEWTARSVTFHFTKGEPHGFGQGITVRRLATQEEAAKALAYQETLTKAGTVAKRKTVVA